MNDWLVADELTKRPTLREGKEHLCTAGFCTNLSTSC